MSQTDSTPMWTTLQEFDASLESLLADAHRGDVTFDRSWTFRRPDETPDVMVEITRLAGDADAATSREDDGHGLDERTFEAKLSRLLRRAYRGGVTFDRSWTIAYADGPDLMVEVIRLAKPGTAACPQ